MDKSRLTPDEAVLLLREETEAEMEKNFAKKGGIQHTLTAVRMNQASYARLSKTKFIEPRPNNQLSHLSTDYKCGPITAVLLCRSFRAFIIIDDTLVFGKVLIKHYDYDRTTE